MIIDFHTHIGQVWDAYPPMTEDLMLKWMDEHGVDQAVLLPLESPESASFYCLTRDVLAAAQRHPDRFIAFCVVDPRMSMSRRESFRDVIRGYLDQGARGFGEVKVGLPFDDPQLQVLYEACDEFHLPLVFHLDGVRCTDTVDLTRLERMLQTYPNVHFAGHATGWWSAISGDMTEEEINSYPQRPVAPGGRVDYLLQTYPNMYGDLSAGSGHNAIARDLAFGAAFLERNRDKLLFGTDYLFEGQHVPQFELFEQLELSPEAWAAISHQNAQRLLKR